MTGSPKHFLGTSVTLFAASLSVLRLQQRLFFSYIISFFIRFTVPTFSLKLCPYPHLRRRNVLLISEETIHFSVSEYFELR